jgi:hypothetical protein
MSVSAPTFMSAVRLPPTRRASASTDTGVDARHVSVEPSGPAIRPRLSQATSTGADMAPAGIPVQRMFRWPFGGGSKKETPRESVDHSTFGTSPIPMSNKNFIPEDELRETNQRQANILAKETKQLRDSHIAPYERRAQSLLATSKSGDGSPISGSDYSQAALDGVTQGVAENLLGGTRQYHAHTQSMMDHAGSLSTNKEFDDFYGKFISPGTK